MDQTGSTSLHGCILCGRKGRKIYSSMKDVKYNVEGLFDFARCDDCDLLWIDPRPTEDEVKKFYENYFTHDMNRYQIKRTRGGIANLAKDVIRQSVLCGHYGYRGVHKRHILCRLGTMLRFLPFVGEAAAYRLGPLLPRFDEIKDSTIIDVGCGDGEYLGLLQEIGCKVLGIEPDSAACSVLSRKNIPFFNGRIEDAGLMSDSTTLVTMRHVVEHLTHPMRTVDECFRILKPGGKLIVSTPNTASLAHLYFKNYWYPMDTPRHLNLFSPKSIKLLAKKSRFGGCEMRTLSATAENTYDISKAILDRGQVRSAPVLPQKGRTWFGIKERTLSALGLPLGEEIEAIFTKGL